MINVIPEEILKRSKSALDDDCFKIYNKSHQIYIYDLLERIEPYIDIQIISLKLYTDGNMIIAENTKEIIYKGRGIFLLNESKRIDLTLERNSLVKLPVSLISFNENILSVFVDKEYIDKLDESGFANIIDS